MNLFKQHQDKSASDVLASGTRYTCRPIPPELLRGDTWREMGGKRCSVEHDEKTVIMTPAELAEALACCV